MSSFYFLAFLRHVLLALCLSCTCLGVHAQQETERSKQKKQAENQRADLRRQLATLKQEINRTESARESAADALAKSETAMSNARRNLRNLAREQRDTQARLTELSRQITELQQTTQNQQAQLGVLLRAQYATKSQNRVKLLLSGDNPNHIHRQLHYMDYVSRTQTSLLASLHENLHNLEQSQAKTQNAKAELDEITTETRQQHALLQKEKNRHAQLVMQLSGKLAAQRKQADTLQQDERRLAELVSRLNALIAQQRQAEAAAKKQPQGGKNITRNNVTPQPGMADGAFAALRGKLRLPIAGDITARFGSRRGDGPTWKGLFIRAPEGTEVRAIASGRVVFADWLRGFGNLVIIDHGSQYMTVYGNNQAILKHPGDAVKSGDVIASTGKSGGNDQSGLYFEMRHQGHAFDPLKWVTIR